jgi:geranyl-CoA carboxylase alpha subunit
MKIKKLLIANRGEIALRILRTARELGYPIVAVYSDQDKDAAHVALADQRVHLYGNTLSDTYLNISAIIKAAKDTGADAIHPGYGFLSENPLFAKACETEGILFIGPDSSAISAMGNKLLLVRLPLNTAFLSLPVLQDQLKIFSEIIRKLDFQC